MGLQQEKDAATRRRILVAARVVFDRDGFHQARIADVAREAGTAIGTFYRHFPTKAELFATLYAETMNADYIERVLQDLLIEPFTGPSLPSDPASIVESAVRKIILSYRSDHTLFAIIEQLASSDKTYQRLHMSLRDHSVEVLAQFIETVQRHGLARSSLDPVLTARAMLSQISHSCHMWFALDESFDERAAITTITQLWVGGLGLPMAPTGRRIGRAAANP